MVLLVAGAPPLWRDRWSLWNYVEQCEKRIESCLAREIQVLLPVEMSVEANVSLAQTYADQVFVQSGMIVDLNVWLIPDDNGSPLPCASLLLTTREVTRDGFGSKVRERNDRACLIAWREQWAKFANDALAAHGFPATLDHWSNYARSIDLEPQNKIGAAAGRRDRPGEVMERVVEHEGIASRNQGRWVAASKEVRHRGSLN